VLLMDEATANVDYATDKLIQETLRTSPAFKGRSIIVIAHRIRTVMDSDLIVVFEGGQVLETGAPAQLLTDEESVFAGMVRETQGAAT
jgi:ABC-type multidrug transport system fused ATPase/permease subunit